MVFEFGFFFVLIFFSRVHAYEAIINNSKIWWKKIKQNKKQFKDMVEEDKTKFSINFF